MVFKIDVNEINKDTNLKLFVTHSYGYQVELPNIFIEVGKKSYENLQ